MLPLVVSFIVAATSVAAAAARCTCARPSFPVDHSSAKQVELSEGLAKPDSSEPKMVHAAEYATATFANKDVSRAVLRAQQQAKAQYEAMMASALKAEAQAHKAGQKATEQSLAAQAKAEQMKIQQRRLRASA